MIGWRGVEDGFEDGCDVCYWGGSVIDGNDSYGGMWIVIVDWNFVRECKEGYVGLDGVLGEICVGNVYCG